MAAFRRLCTRNHWSRAVSGGPPTPTTDLANYLRAPRQCFVIVSKSSNIYANLSLEDWLYANCSFEPDVSGFLMWINDPCIVIGRHQNPWTECNINECHKRSISVVRRNSGGGTVYHDRGNLNLSFLTSKRNYCRRRNLSFISDTLLRYYGIECDITAREDLVLRASGHKISGTASKLAAHAAYHHCTLLVDVDTADLRASIRKQQSEHLTSKATESVRSPVENLRQAHPQLSMDTLVTNLATAFADIYKVKEPLYLYDDHLYSLPGFEAINERFQSWNWIYGKTPRFFVDASYRHQNRTYKVTLEIYHGLVEQSTIEGPADSSQMPQLKGLQYDPVVLSEAIRTWTAQQNHSEWSVLAGLALLNAVESTF